MVGRGKGAGTLRTIGVLATCTVLGGSGRLRLMLLILLIGLWILDVQYVPSDAAGSAGNSQRVSMMTHYLRNATFHVVASSAAPESCCDYTINLHI